MNEVKEFCEQRYETLFDSEYIRLEQLANKRIVKSDEPEIIRDQIRVQARKYSIQETVYEALKLFLDVEPSEIWKYIYVAHVFHRSGETNLEKIRKITSADQSWKKSSGHAFESMIKSMSNPLLKPHSIEILLQKDVNYLLSKGKINNPEPDIIFIKSQIKKTIFDLFIATTDENGNYRIFGVIQSKTSIRERVARDREPSLNAMQHFFLSIAIVLDGDFLKLPKFKSMINGQTDEHVLNGWHAMYVFTNDKSFEKDRVFVFNSKMTKFVSHMIEAASFWKENRQWMNHNWRPSS